MLCSSQGGWKRHSVCVCVGEREMGWVCDFCNAGKGVFYDFMHSVGVHLEQRGDALDRERERERVYALAS